MRVRTLKRIWRRWSDESGVTVLLALFALIITTLLLGAVYMALNNDTALTRADLDQSRSYSAAQAGIAQYIYQLNSDPNYWENCNSVGSKANPIAVPNSTDGGSTEYYYYKPLVASDQQCDVNNPTATMIEGSGSPAPGTFRISSTGVSNNISRTIVAQFKQPSFLSFVYYTDYETLDPAALFNPNSKPTEPTDCARHFPNRGNDCGGPIDFVNGDQINGPLHSEDTLAICGAPVFGRTGRNDTIETAAPLPGMSTEGQSQQGVPCQQNATVNNNGKTIATSVTSLTPPATNSQLLTTAQTGYVYTGKTTIALSGTTMSVTNTNAANKGLTGASVAWPSNGVIYVSTASKGCGVTYTPFTANAAYAGDANCGNVYVSGNYTKSLTIAADSDVVITGNITSPEVSNFLGNAPSGSQLLGLVANDFVRVYNAVPGRTGSTSGSCGPNNSNPPSSGTAVSDIYAAILAVNHSFIVDNYDCGGESPALGTLYVYGAIAQLFRGPVGTGGSGGASSGYTKSYNYDDRLANEEPPYFLDPVSAQWFVSRQTECNSTATC